MKKRMRLAAMLTGAVMLGSTVPAVSVSALHCWGTASGDEFQDMTVLDDKGMFAGVSAKNHRYQVCTYHYERDAAWNYFDSETGEYVTETVHLSGDPLYVVYPRDQWFQFVLCDGLDANDPDTQKKVFEILDKYYPQISVQFQLKMYDWDVCAYQTNNGFEIVDKTEIAGSEDITNGIMRDLAAAELISAFYAWGQTANYQEIVPHYVTAYHPTDRNWDAIETWVNDQYPECEFVCATPEDTEIAKLIGYYSYEQDTVYFNDRMYAIIPPEGTSFAEQFTIAAELYTQFGIKSPYEIPESISSDNLIGQNALAVSGDINIDCSIDVSDAVLLARYTAEDATAQITQTGLGNADMDGDGIVTLLDVTTLLKQIAGIA